MPSSILVIKLGALGDFVQALGPMTAIRNHHQGDHLILLTTAPYEDFARASHLFEDIWLDSRPKGLAVGHWMSLRRRLRGCGFKRVYDLQTSDRSSFYFRLLWPGPYPEWSGIARRCSHPHSNPRRDFMHTIERQAEQLHDAGIDDIPLPNVDWAEANVNDFDLQSSYALFAPGGAAHRPAKRWPAAYYADVMRDMVEKGVQPVLIGGADEHGLLDHMAEKVPGVLNLAGRTSLLQLAEMGRHARFALGNDTGPMHLLAVAGCASVVLYSDDSDPDLCAQRGPRVEILRRASLMDLQPGEVQTSLQGFLD